MDRQERANNSWRLPDDWTPFADLGGLIRLVLLVDWDPIGLFGIAEAMDQYDRYVDAVWDLMRRGASRDELAEHLSRVATEQMGMRGARVEQRTQHTADKLLLLYRIVCQYELRFADS